MRELLLAAVVVVAVGAGAAWFMAAPTVRRPGGVPTATVASTHFYDLAAADAATAPVAATQPSDEDKEQPVPAALDFRMKSLESQDVDLSQYRGDVVLMVNVASKCGLTPQYEALQKLHEEYADEGLRILGFPANNFGQQEPGTNEEIAAFCERNYGVGFDMFSKISVKGEDQAPLYRYLTEQQPREDLRGEISWNFEKFLLNRQGEVVARFPPKTPPDAPEVVQAIDRELARK